MIQNADDVTEYKSYDKIYIPTQYINNNWSYRLNGDFITIITNNNCQTQYTSTYCNCYYYNYKNNIISDVYSCNINNNNPSIPFVSITDDVNFSISIREKFIQDKSLFILMFVIGILFAIFLTKERKSI